MKLNKTNIADCFKSRMDTGIVGVKEGIWKQLRYQCPKQFILNVSFIFRL